MLLQAIWTTGTGWDDPVVLDILDRWYKWMSELPAVESLEVPRLLIPPGTTRIDLHCYGDASEIAHGFSLYVRCEQEDGQIYVNFVAAKVKVVPVKPLTMPRAELLAALLSYRLSSHYARILREQYLDHPVEHLLE